MRILPILLPASLALMPALDCAAADFDGTKPFLCATMDVASCAPGQDCARESAQTVNAPEFFVVDVSKKLVSERGNNSAGRTSKIDHVEHQSGLLMLAGTDGAESWAASVVESNGKLSYSVVGDRMIVAAFGACVIQR
jgi:hypothetical protein